MRVFFFLRPQGICGEPSASVLAGYTSHGQVPVPHSPTMLSASFPLKPICHMLWLEMSPGAQLWPTAALPLSFMHIFAEPICPVDL